MNSKKFNTRLTPSMAVIVYAGKGYNKEFYLESREIKSHAGQLTFMAPVPLSDSVMQKIADLYKQNKDSEMELGLLPEHILYASNNSKLVVAWYRPAMKRALNFSSHLRIKGDQVIELPATLYLVIDKTMYVFALMNNARPNLKTKLYNAPFFNIYKDGNVCLGSANVGRRAKNYADEAQRFEAGFYMAEQNNGFIKNCKTALDTLWPSLIKTKRPFPSKDELVQHSTYKTFGDLINKLIEKK